MGGARVLRDAPVGHTKDICLQMWLSRFESSVIGSSGFSVHCGDLVNSQIEGAYGTRTLHDQVCVP